MATESVSAASLTELYATHRLYLVRLAVLLVDDVGTAEDVVQDAFTALHRRGQDAVQPPAMLGYLRTSVINGCRSVQRRRAISRRVGLRLLQPQTVEAADAGILLAAQHRAVLDAVRSLSRRQREVLMLRYWGGLSEAEIANTLGISAGTVKSTASRALHALSARTEEYR